MGMKLRRLTFGILAASFACTADTLDPDSVTRLYDAVEVEGHTLPVTLERSEAGPVTLVSCQLTLRDDGRFVEARRLRVDLLNATDSIEGRWGMVDGEVQLTSDDGLYRHTLTVQGNGSVLMTVARDEEPGIAILRRYRFVAR